MKDVKLLTDYFESHILRSWSNYVTFYWADYRWDNQPIWYELMQEKTNRPNFKNVKLKIKNVFLTLISVNIRLKFIAMIFQ